MVQKIGDDDRPLIVLPDIHGHLRVLEKLLKKLRVAGLLEGRQLVFLGDYLDRGPDIKELMEWCVAHKDEHVFLMGNHEYVFLAAHDIPDAEGDDFNDCPPLWSWAHGYKGGTTAKSYGINGLEEYQFNRDFLEDRVHELAEKMGAETCSFLRSLPLFYETKKELVIHAGLHPTDSWESQRAELLMGPHPRWPMPMQLSSHDLAGMAVHQANKTLITGHWPLGTQLPQLYERRVMLHLGVESGYPLAAWVTDLECVVIEPRF